MNEGEETSDSEILFQMLTSGRRRRRHVRKTLGRRRRRHMAHNIREEEEEVYEDEMVKNIHASKRKTLGL